MTESQVKRHFPHEVEQQPDAISSTGREVAKALQDPTLRDMFQAIDRVVWVGSGDCYFVGAAISAFFESQAGVPTTWMEAYDFVHETPAIDEKSLVISFSSSGTSVYAVEALNVSRKVGARTISVANRADSRLESVAEFSLLTKAGDSYTFPTKTTTCALLLAMLLSIEVGKCRKWGAKSQYPDVEKIAESVEKAIECTKEIAPELATGIKESRRVLCVGNGMERSAALIGAAKLIETSHVPTTSCNCEEFLHLHGFGTTPQDVVMVFDDGNLRTQRAIEYAVEQGCFTIVLCAENSEKFPDEAHTVCLPRVCNTVLRLFDYIVSSHVVAAAVSKAKGTNPDIPSGVNLEGVINLLYTDPVDGWNIKAAEGLKDEK